MSSLPRRFDIGSGTDIEHRISQGAILFCLFVARDLPKVGIDTQQWSHGRDEGEERKGRPRKRLGEVIADNAYDTEKIRGYLRLRRIKGNLRGRKGEG